MAHRVASINRYMPKIATEYACSYGKTWSATRLEASEVWTYLESSYKANQAEHARELRICQEARRNMIWIIRKVVEEA